MIDAPPHSAPVIPFGPYRIALDAWCPEGTAFYLARVQLVVARTLNQALIMIAANAQN